MKLIIPMLKKLHDEFVLLPLPDWLDPKYELSTAFNAFNGCIGAIDGTYFEMRIPTKDNLRWYNCKSVVTTNVFVAVRSDCSFSFVLAGAEGSMNDASLLYYAIGRGFKVPKGRYYLAD